MDTPKCIQYREGFRPHPRHPREETPLIWREINKRKTNERIQEMRKLSNSKQAIPGSLIHKFFNISKLTKEEFTNLFASALGGRKNTEDNEINHERKEGKN